MNDVAAPCMKLLTIGFLVLLTISRFTLLVSVSCLKLPVLEITAPGTAVEVEEPPVQVHSGEGFGVVTRAASHWALVTPD